MQVDVYLCNSLGLLACTRKKIHLFKVYLKNYFSALVLTNVIELSKDGRPSVVQGLIEGDPEPSRRSTPYFRSAVGPEEQWCLPVNK